MYENLRTEKEIGVNMFAEKGLYVNGELTPLYFDVYKKYKVLLEKYLLDVLSLKDYDDRIKNSGLLFIPVKGDDKDMYQGISSMGLDYIYLRNDLSIEKLSIDEIRVLNNASIDDLVEPNEMLLNIVKNTYKFVIDSNDNPEVRQMNCYGIDSERFWFDSSEMVFGFRYDEFAENGLNSEEEWKNNNFQQTEFLNNILEEMSIKCTSQLGLKVNFIRYNEFTVKNSMAK